MESPTPDVAPKNWMRLRSGSQTRRIPVDSPLAASLPPLPSPGSEGDMYIPDPLGSPSSGLDEEEHGLPRNGLHSDTSSDDSGNALPERLSYLPGDIHFLDQAKLPTVKPAAFLVAFLLAITAVSRHRDSDAYIALRLTEIEVAIVSALFVCIASGMEALVTRPALQLHKLSTMDYVKVISL